MASTKSILLSTARKLLAQMHNTTIIPLSFIFNRGGFVTDIADGSFNKMPFIALVGGVNALTSIFGVIPAGQRIEALISEVLFITGNMWYYKFLINPQNVSFGLQKLQVEEETSDIPILNTYRNKIMPMTFTGISGCTIPRDLLAQSKTDGLLVTDNMLKNPKLSAAWMKFRQLEKFYNEVNGDIAILFDMDLYIGKFVSFNYSQNAENPWQIDYTLSMKIYPDLILHTLNVYDYATFFDALYARYSRFLADDFEGKYSGSLIPS